MGEANRFNATLGVTNAPAASEAWAYIERGEPVPNDPPKYLRTMVGDYIGAGNYWITNQASFVPVGYTKDAAGNFIKQGSGPTPPSGDPIQPFRDRQFISQNCAWFLITPTESNAMKAKYGELVISQYNNFYTPGGTGALGVNERWDSAEGYVYVGADQLWHPDVNQAADKRVQEIADSQNPPRAVPPPFNAYP